MKADRELEAMNAAFAALNELNGEERIRVLEWLIKRLDVGSLAGKMQGQFGVMQLDRKESGAGTSVTRVEGSPRAFIKEKKPSMDVERVTCLAYYLTHVREVPIFKTMDITRLNSEAGQPRFSNPAFAVSNATWQNQYLASVGGGKKQITVRGEALVEALPERERVIEALASNPILGRKKRKVTRTRTK